MGGNHQAETHEETPEVKSATFEKAQNHKYLYSRDKGGITMQMPKMFEAAILNIN